MSSSPAAEPSNPIPPASTPVPSSPALRPPEYVTLHTSTPNYVTGAKKQHPPLNVVLPSPSPSTPPTQGEPTLTPPPRSPGGAIASGDSRTPHPPDGTSSDKSSETAVGVSRTPSAALSRKESYKAQRQNYRREKKRATSALLHSIEDPAVVVLADWLKVRGSLKSWTKLWCVLKPGLLLLYKSPKAKSSHWVGTVLLTSCQVIERPSKKDGFCFKLYHPLEQSIWAPRGPSRETIGAVVQPLPTAHLIFRAPSQAAGHCWLDGLELALRCSNAMLRCSRNRQSAVAEDAPTTPTHISHEELEKHFNEHVLKLCEITNGRTPTPLMSVNDYSPKRHSSADRKAHKPKKMSRWSQFLDNFDHKDASTDSETPDNERSERSFLDFHFLKNIDFFERNLPSTSSLKVSSDKKPKKKSISKSLASSPKLELKKPSLLRFFEMPKLPITLGDKPTKSGPDKSTPTLLEGNVSNFFPQRRSSTPCVLKCGLTQKRISELRESGSKTDSENDGSLLFKKEALQNRQRRLRSQVVGGTPENVLITTTAPSGEIYRKYSSSSTDDIADFETHRASPSYYTREHLSPTPEKFALIDYRCLPSVGLGAMQCERRDERVSSQSVYVAGKIVQTELAGAASDTDSDASLGASPIPLPPTLAANLAANMAANRATTPARVRELMEQVYVEDPDRETGAAGELVEEVAEENKSLLWFLLKQVRPGMDLSKVVLPTFILEPRSFLDKLSDNYYHADLLTKAGQLDDPYLRFMQVLRWYLSGLYRKPKGLKKPYNPVLGETFRCCWRHSEDDTHTFYVAEQVSHHPPVSAFYVSNRQDGFVVEGSLLARSKFYGNSTSAILEGCATVHLLGRKERYVTSAPYAHCKGIVIGTLSMELGGKVQVICPETGYHADIEFKLRSFLSSAADTNAITGRIKKGKDTIATLDGYWDARIDVKDKRTGEETMLLDVSILKQQRLSRYLMKMENQQDFESQKLWRHVSEAIANDDQIAATEQKTIVEEAQRARARDQTADTWTPRYFRKDFGVTLDGIIDQGWQYTHLNTSPWSSDELMEYEEDFVIRSLRLGALSRTSIRFEPAIELSSRDMPAREISAREMASREVSSRDMPARNLSPRELSARNLSARELSSRETSAREMAASRASVASESDSQDDGPRTKTTVTRTLKQSLLAIDLALREQTHAIERLSRSVSAMGESQASLRRYIRDTRTTTHSWDLFGGFILALILQAVLNWVFTQSKV